MRFLGLDIVSRNVPSKRAANIFDESYWEGKEIGPLAVSGARVTPLTAMQVSAVNAAVRVIAETVASLPLILYRKLDKRNREHATDHPLYPLLHDNPNDYMTSFEWIELMARHLLLRGNSYSKIVFQGITPIKILPLHPDQMTLRWISKGKQKYLQYEYNEDGKREILKEVLHWRGPSEDGGRGRGPLQEAREVVGNAISLDLYQNYFYTNSARMSGVLQHPSALTDESADRISKSFREAYTGAANSGKVAVLEEGMEFKPISMTPKDAEFVASKKLSVRDIARIFRVPPHMIGDLEDATFSNIEQESISFVVHTIRPWTVRIEKALNRCLLSEDEQQEYYFEFLLDGLLRGDIKSRYEAYQIGLQNGILMLNDVREKENMNSLEWGETSMIPFNMRPIQSNEDLRKQIDAPKPSDAKALPAPDEKKSTESAGVFIDMFKAEERIVESHKLLFERAFAWIARREASLLDRKFESDAEFRGTMKEFEVKHKKEVHAQLLPIVQAFSNQLQLLAEMFFQESSAVSPEFMADYAQEHIDGWWDQVGPSEGDERALSLINDKKKERLYQDKALPLMQRIRDIVFAKKGETK